VELYGLVLAPRLKKDTNEFGEPICNLRANVPAFISNLRPNNKPEMLQFGPKFFQP